jgi:parallel beta-helix repeat protein
MKKQQVVRWTLCPLALAWVAHARGATIVVPTDQPTIQAAVDAASPGDTIRVQPGSYQESVRIRGAKTGLTIEAADATDPPTIHGTANKSGDGIRVDSVNGVVFRNLRLVGAYDGVRLNSVRNAIVVGLDIENSALGIRVNHGQGTIVDRCIVLGTRVEQGILVASAPGTLIRGSTISDTDREGIRVEGSPGVVLEDDLVSGSRSAAGIAVVSSPGVEIDGCVVSDSSGDGIHVTSSAGLVLSGNSATDNLEIGLSISRSPPFRSVADVIAAGNSASGNRAAEIKVSGASGTTSTTIAGGTTTSSTTTSTTRAASTTTTSTTRVASTTTTSSLPAAQARWRFYVRIALDSGGTVNVNVPLRSGDAALAVAVPAQVLAAFPIGQQTAGSDVPGGDTLQLLTSAASNYIVSHPADYPDFAGVVALRWAMRVSS